MSDGERTVQTWRPNPLPSANKGSNVKSSYINRHTDPQKEKTVFSFLDCSLMGNAPMAPIYGHMQHICNTFSLQASDGQGFQSILRLATSGATAACTSLGPSSSCGNNDGSPGSSDDVRSVYPPVLANDATVKGKSMIKQLDTVCSAISQRPWNQPKEEHLFQMPCFFAPKQDEPHRANSSPLLIHSSGWANSCGSPSISASNKNLRKPLEQVPWKLLEVVFNYVSVNLEVG